MKTVVSVIVFMFFLQAMGAVQEGSIYPEDALLVSDTVQEYLGRELAVSFKETDSTLVLFVSLGGEWRGGSDQWTELIFISSYAASLDLQRSWSVKDIAVSFGGSWCRLSMNEIFEIATEELTETEFLEKFQAITEVFE